MELREAILQRKSIRGFLDRLLLVIPWKRC